MFSVSSLVARLPVALPPMDVSSHLSGARLFHVAAEDQGLWLADLPRFPGRSQPLRDHLFVSADGRNFHQLRTVEYQDGLILTDTPGFVSALAMYQEKGVALVFSAPGDPLAGVQLCLDRVSSKELSGASFFPAPPAETLHLRSDGPRVRASERNREPDRRLRKVQDHLVALDRGRRHLKEYRTDRGLEEASSYAQETPFGTVEGNLQARLKGRDAYRSQPVKLLTIGPGQGRMEAEVAKRLHPHVSIDAFAVGDAIEPGNWHALNNLFIGNLDTHRLPQGYDVILSIFGSSYAVDQRRALAQILDALNPGGEAVFQVTGEMIAGHEPESLSYDEAQSLQRRYGIVYQAVPNPETALRGGILVETVYVRKTKETPPAEEILKPEGDFERASRRAWEVFELVAQSRDYDVDPTLSDLDLARFRERLALKCRYWASQGHTSAIQTVLFAWHWIEEQGVLVKR